MKFVFPHVFRELVDFCCLHYVLHIPLSYSDAARMWKSMLVLGCVFVRLWFSKLLIVHVMVVDGSSFWLELMLLLGQWVW